MKTTISRFILVASILNSFAMARAADNAVGFTEPSQMPCFEFKDAFKKNEAAPDEDAFSKADARLQEAFMGVNPFSHQWMGENSYIIFGQKRSIVKVKPDVEWMASMAGEPLEQPIRVEKVCIDLENKPFVVLNDAKKETTKKVPVIDGKITLGKGMHSDTYKINVSPKPLKKNASVRASAQPAMSKRPQMTDPAASVMPAGQEAPVAPEQQPAAAPAQAPAPAPATPMVH